MTRENSVAPVLRSLYYDVLQATTMLLFLLSGVAVTRKNHQLPSGGATPVALPGLPDLCISPYIIRAPDDYLYGPTGAAAQIVYKGWVAEVFGLWENHYRNELKASLTGSPGHNLIRPQLDAFGDLRQIRNDLFHNNCIASAGHTGKCTVLHWFTPDEPIILCRKHVFDFLNQAGVLMLARDQRGCAVFSAAFNLRSYSYGQSVDYDKDALLNWQPKPRLISVRTHQDNVGPIRFKGVTPVFDNGLFAHIPIGPLDATQQTMLGEARIVADGNLQFGDGTSVHAWTIYRNVVRAWCEPCRDDDGPGDPVDGPWIKIRK